MITLFFVKFVFSGVSNYLVIDFACFFNTLNYSSLDPSCNHKLPLRRVRHFSSFQISFPWWGPYQHVISPGLEVLLGSPLGASL